MTEERIESEMKDTDENTKDTSAPSSGAASDALPSALPHAPSSSAREGRILSELAAAIHTLESISEVLDDVMNLTDPNPSHESMNRDTESIAVKQLRLLGELKQWSTMSCD